MTSLMNKCLTDTSVLPPDILSLEDSEFFEVVEDLTNDIVASILRIQAIQNVQIFMFIPDILDVFKIDSPALDYLKNQACFRLRNNSHIVKPGIEASLRYLRDLFTMKIHEYFNLDTKQQTDINIISDLPASSNDNVAPGQKRAASFPNQVPNKRGRK